MNPTWTRRRLITNGFAALTAASLAPPGPAEAADPIAAGSGSIELTPDPKRSDRALKVWTYRPADFGPNSPILFVMHGVKRDGKGYRDAWIEQSRAGNFLLLVPEFPADRYPTEAYQQGNVRDAKGGPVPAEQWTFTAIEKMFDQVRELTKSRVEKYHLFGHSAGGQFVHRFVLFMPEARYARAVAANPGFYTFPSQDAEYPYGLKGTPITGRPAAATFGRDFVLLLGEADTNRDDPDLRKTPPADAQGRTRLERGKNYFQAATEAAQRDGAAFHWRLVTVPEVGHSDAKMAPAAARELFAKAK